MADPKKIETAIRRVRNQKAFIQDLLIDALGWDIDQRAEEVEEISFEWSADELRAEGLGKHLVDGTIRQIQPFKGNPWGIFILEFKNPDVFLTSRGMTGTLRNVLRGLVPSKKKRSSLASFGRENLLFICNHDYQHYRFAHFKAPGKDSQTAPLAAFGWGPDDPIRTLCECNLNALEWPETATDPQGWIDAWSQAFDVEKVTKRFYEDYAAVFEQVEKLIAKQNELKGDDLRMFTQTLFNRLMFLRFMERKGWLTFDGKKHYLRALYAAGGHGKKSFYKGRLCPLFFEGLAIEGKQQSEAYGQVPYLNGGLFERSELDKQVTDLPDEVFAGILADEHAGGLFYRYNFTVEESTPLDIEVAVDPEMLGKVFEELVTGRHESGSYYTPRPVVSFMCREALKGYLSDKLLPSPAGRGAGGEGAREKIEQLVAALVDRQDVGKLKETHAREILAALDDLKAVDPACGSGAYLLGLLQEMIVLYRLLYSEKLVKDARTLYDLKLRIISQSLYGVDIDPFATNIAMLRLWLSLIVEADEPVPLPNLDFKIETGDSLLAPDPQEMPDLFRGLLQASADVLAMVKNQFFLSHGEEKESYRKTIISEEARLRKELAAEYGEGVVDWRIQFAEAFAQKRGGFDVVLANPPYISANRIPGDKRDAFAAYMDKLKCVFGFKSDLYVHFFYRALQLLRANGIFAAITSNTYLTNTTKTFLRKRLLTNDVRWLIPMGPDVFAATVYSSICIVQNRTPAPDASVGFLNLRQAEMLSLLNGYKALAAGHQIPASEYRQAFESLFFEPTPANRQLFSKLLSASGIVVLGGRRFVPLDFVAPALDTGIHSGNIRTRLFYEIQPVGRCLPKLLQGKQVVKYWSCWDAPGARFRYVDVEYVPDERRKGIGRGGKPSGKGEYWHFCGPPQNHHVPERLLMRQTEDEPFVGYIRQVNERIYTDNTLHTLLLTERGRQLGLSYFYLLAILNSATMCRIYQAVAQEEGRTLAQVKTTLVNRLPIPLPGESAKATLEGLVSEICALYEKEGFPLSARAERHIADLQVRIDDVVAQLYTLDGL